MVNQKWNNMELYTKWKSGCFKTIKEMSTTLHIPYSTLVLAIRETKGKLIDNSKIQQIAMEKASNEMANRIVEAQTRQADLGKAMTKRALETVDTIDVKDASQLSSLASAGVTIERKALGLKDDKDDSKVTIQLAVGIKLGNEQLGTINVTPIPE
jgi:hypothetical protein